MMRVLIAALFTLSIASAAAAQTVPVQSPVAPSTSIQFEHDGVGMSDAATSGFLLEIDKQAPAVVSFRPVPNVEKMYLTAFPALTLGLHELRLYAFNADGFSVPSPVLAVRIFVLPNAPTNLRLVTARLENGVWVPVLELL